MYDRLVDLMSRNRAYSMADERRQIQTAKDEYQQELDRQRAEMKKAEEERRSWKNTLISAAPGVLTALAAGGAMLVPGGQALAPLLIPMMAGGVGGAAAEAMNTRAGGPFQGGAMTQLGVGLGSNLGGAIYGQQGAAKLPDTKAPGAPGRGLSTPMPGPPGTLGGVPEGYFAPGISGFQTPPISSPQVQSFLNQYYTPQAPQFYNGGYGMPPVRW